MFRIPIWLDDNLPFFEYFTKIVLTTSLRKARRGRDLSPSSLLKRYNTHTPWRTTSTIQTDRYQHHFFIQMQSCNCLRFGPFCWQNHFSGCNSSIDLVVVLNTLSFNFVPTLRKSLKFTRFRSSSVNRPVVVLTN